MNSPRCGCSNQIKVHVVILTNGGVFDGTLDAIDEKLFSHLSKFTLARPRFCIGQLDKINPYTKFPKKHFKKGAQSRKGLQLQLHKQPVYGKKVPACGGISTAAGGIPLHRVAVKKAAGLFLLL